MSNFGVRRYHVEGKTTDIDNSLLRSKMRRIARQSWTHSQRVSHTSNNSEAFAQ